MNLSASFEKSTSVSTFTRDNRGSNTGRGRGGKMNFTSDDS